MKTFVITGGTDGMGRGLALAYLERGDQVAVIGRDAAKGRALLEAATRLGAAGRLHFLPADLSLLSENRRVISELADRFAKIDALVLCARHYRSTRLVTAEGFEHTFALGYLSRFVLSHGLAGLLDAAEHPVILNVAGPGTDPGGIHWDDLGLERGYHGVAALIQSGRLNDLLGVGFAAHRPGSRARYVLFHPGQVNTGFSGQYDRETAAQIEAIRQSAKSVEQAIRPMLSIVDNPPAALVSASVMGQPLSVDGPAFDAEDARRLHLKTTALLAPRSTVSEAKLNELLDSRVFAQVATIMPDGRPHQSVVWVQREGADVLFMVAVGSRKERNLRRDPRVSVLVSPADAPYTYAAIHGTAKLEAAGSHELRDTLALKYLGLTHADHIARTPEAGTDRRPITVVRVTPDKVVGRL